MIDGEIFKDFYPVFEKDGDVTVSSILGYESPGLTSSMAAGRYLMEAYRWRLRTESNRCTRSCSPLHNHSATQP